MAVKLLAEHLAEDEDFVARFRREALAAAKLQHPNVVQVFDSGEDPGPRTATTSSWSTWTALVRRHAARPEAARRGRGGADRARRLPRPRLRPPRRGGAPRREARQPAGGQRERHHQAGRLRHRQGRRADPHHPGGLGARHRRLPLPRAGARRGGRARLGHLLARRVRLPVPGRAAAARVLRRSPSWRSSSRRRPSSRSPIHRPEVPAELDRAIRVCLARDPAARYASTLEMARALDAGMQAAR